MPNRFLNPLCIAAVIGCATVGLTAVLAPPGDAAFSGENGKIVFVSNRTGNDEIWMMNADGSNEKQLTHSPSRDISPAWSADGKGIVFASQRDNGSDFEIYSMTAAGDTGPDADVLRWTSNTCKDHQPAFAPGAPYGAGNSAIVFEEECPDASRFNIMTKHRDSNSTRLTNRGDNRRPSYSPNGQKILFDGTRLVFPRVLSTRYVIVMNADGSTEKNLIEGAESPTFSPEGDRIAYTDYTRSHTGSRIFGTDPDGTQGENMVNEPAAYPSYSPDATRMAYERNNDIFSSNITNCGAGSASRDQCAKGAVQLTVHGKNLQPDWGPKPSP